MSTDPTALAREVLDAAHEDETVTVCTIPDNKAATLARAVIELTAERDAYREESTRLREEIARVEALADWLEATAQPSTFTGGRQLYCAHRIRAALNGGNA